MLCAMSGAKKDLCDISSKSEGFSFSKGFPSYMFGCLRPCIVKPKSIAFNI